MTDSYEKTIADRACDFANALQGAGRVSVYRPNALGEWDVETFSPEAVRAMVAEARNAVKVKPLAWEGFGERAAKAPAFYSASYLITRWNGRGQFEVSLSYPGYQTGCDGERRHETMEAAKAAAQKDYEHRILGALEDD